MSMVDIVKSAENFAERVEFLKTTRPDVPWYPYQSFANLQHFLLFNGAGRNLFAGVGPGTRVLDIGTGDGDIAFLLESFGCIVTALDNPATNANGCRGILEMRAMLGSVIGLQCADVDWIAALPGQYEIAFCLGTLYHLRNPALVLNSLAQCTNRLLLSTVVFYRLNNGVDVENQQLAYFVDCREINNDPTYYWIFTPQALRILLRRCGWKVIDEIQIGAVKTASPGHGDSRMLCYCERVPNWADLRLHHDF